MLQKPMWFAILSLGVLSITLAPFVLPSYHLYLACLVMINVIMALGLNVLTGNSGQISLCHSSFMAMGAYLFTILNNSMHWNIVWCGLLSVSAAGLGGWIVGYPARRLAGIYLALATLAFLALTQTAIEEFPDLTGGIRGLKFEHSVVLGISTHDPRLIFYTIALSCAACLYSIHCLLNFPLGRAWDAIRTSPQAAMALGVPVARTKLIAFTLSAAYAGWAGVLFAWVVGFIDPIEFGVGASLKYITFIVVGGVGSILGSLLGSVSLTLLPEFLRGVKEYSDLVYAVLLLGALMFMPKGLAGWVNGFLIKAKSGAAK
jgi:branched-chain amino acid transport system permease protein